MWSYNKCAFLLVVAQVCFIYCIPTQKLFYGQKDLTSAEKRLLDSWTDDSKQNIWELSGQFEGDIVLEPGQRNGLIATRYRWPNREIPYKIDSVFDTQQRQWIEQSISAFNKETCIKARRATSKDKDYVMVTGANTGCHSKVGRTGGAQTLNLAPNKPGSGCLRHGTIIHEFLHALGFYHQQSTTDRDNYVTIVWDNIIQANKHNFNKYDSDIITSFNQTYDYSSVLHYSAYAFSQNGKKTIVTKDPTAEIGQRAGFSRIDIIKLHKMYNC